MDRRQLRTRALIFDAFSELLNKNKYNSITVQDIIDKAGIGRSTFYSHFETKDELLNAMCTDIIDHVFSEDLKSESSHDFSERKAFKERITHILYHLKDRKQSIKGLFSDECGAIFMGYLKRYLFDIFDDQVTAQDGVPGEYVINNAVSSFAETVRWWLKENSSYTPEDISRFYFSCVRI